MNASELQRKLLYWGYTDLTDYLRNSPLNRYLYKRMLNYKEEHFIETPILTLFNEIYYQCVRVGFDSNPGENIHERYLKEEEYWIKSKDAARMVFSYVWVLLKRKRKLSFNEECFIEHFNSIIQHWEDKASIEEMLADMEEKDIKVPDQFAPMHYPVTGIPIQRKPEEMTPLRYFVNYLNRLIQSPGQNIPSGNSWRDLTNNYSHSLIERYVKLYTSVDDRLALLDHIEHSCTQREHKKHEDFFMGLRLHLTSGNIVYKVLREGEEPTEWEEKGLIGAQEFLNPYTNELQNLAEQYKQERDDVSEQLEQFKKNYEEDVARLEAKYQQEMEKLKTELAQRLKEQGSSEVKEAEKSHELAFTITEIVDDAKSWFHESGASELTNMLYRLTIDHHYMEDDVWTLIKTVIPAVENRLKPHTQIDVATAHQVNVAPQTVNNHVKDEK